MQYRKQFRLNDVITFELGSRFLVLDELDNEGQSVQRLVTGPELGEDGGTNYRFNATLRIDDANDESHYNDGNQPMGTALMDALIEKNPDVRTWRINGRPAAQFLSKKTPINLGGSILKLYMIGIQVPMTSSSAVTFFQVVGLSEDSDENQQHFQDLVDAAKTIRVRGKALNLNGASAAILMEELLPDFQEGEEGVLNLQMGVKVKVGDGEATRIGTITYNRDGSTGFESDDDDDDVSWDDDHDDDDDDDDDDDGEDLWSRLQRIRQLNDRLEELLGDSDEENEWDYPTADPDEYLYSHYGRLKREHDRLSGFGATVIINGQGTDFQPLDLLGILENTGNKSSAVYKVIKDAGMSGADSLSRSALKMAQVFRVNRDAFDSRHDREAGIREGMYEKKYMLSALRSFAWTLAQKADDDGRKISDYDFEELSSLGEFIEARDWLNYEGDSWFEGLCGHSDIHVIYAPQQVFDRKLDAYLSGALRNNPVCSLDALRSDLAALEGVMGVIHNGLLEDRDRSEPLQGALADVLNVWCALCIATQKAFFSEDGPSMYFYSYPDDRLDSSPVRISGSGAAVRKGTGKENPPKSVQADYMKPTYADDGREHFAMGSYSQTGKKDPIEWMILKKEGNHALVLSVRALEARSIGDVSWENCELRSWLNGEFYKNAFNVEEKNAILARSIPNSTVQSDKKTKRDADTVDHVFLLNADEALSLLPTAQERIAKATAHAKKNGAEISTGPDQCHWWLRGPGFMMWAPRIQADGEGNRWGIYSGEVCVRPAMWVDLSKFGKHNAARDPAKQKQSPTNETDKKAELKKTKSSLSVPVLAAPNDCEIEDDCLTAYRGSTPHLILPDEIQSIDSWLFASNKTLVSVVIPEGIEEIAEGTFSMCYNLENVTLPNTIKTIGKSAFSHCKKLKSIVIPDGCEALGDEVFYGCDALENVTLPDTLRTIGEEAFHYCEKLKEIFIPDGCETIGERAFEWCENIHVYIPDSVYEIGEDAFTVDSTDLVIHTVRYSAADTYAEENELKVEYDYYSFKRQECHLGKMDELSNRAKPQSAKNNVPDAVDTDLYFILNNEKLLGKLNRSDEDFYEIYSEDFPRCGETELLRKRREILNASKGEFSIPKQHIDAFKARSVEERFRVATANLFNVNNSEIDFDEKARKAIEQTRDFYTSAEAAEVRRLMDRRLKDTRAEIDGQYDAIEPRWKTYNGAKDHIKIYLVDSDTTEREEDCIFQRESGNALVMIKMVKPEMSFFAVRLINCMAWYWKVTPQKIWEQALQNGIEDQRSYSFGNASEIAQRAFAETFPEVAAAAEREKAERQRANEEAKAKEKREHIQRLERAIRELEDERDNLRGLFKGGKRKKIQAQIDELQNELNSLKR